MARRDVAKLGEMLELSTVRRRSQWEAVTFGELPPNPA
jgi:hypothetical protein